MNILDIARAANQIVGDRELDFTTNLHLEAKKSIERVGDRPLDSYNFV